MRLGARVSRLAIGLLVGIGAPMAGKFAGAHPPTIASL